MAKVAMQIEWYCLAVHKNTHKYILEYAGAKKQTTEKFDFVILYKISWLA